MRVPGTSTNSMGPQLYISRVSTPVNPGSINPAVMWVIRPILPREDLPSNFPMTFLGRVRVSAVSNSTNWPGLTVHSAQPLWYSYSGWCLPT